MTPFPVMAFINEGTTGFINEKGIDGINQAAKVNIITPRSPPSHFLISCFTVLFATSVNRPDFSRDFSILII